MIIFDYLYTMKKCSNCSLEKPLSDFNLRSKNSDKYQSMCKVCDNNLALKRYHQNKEKYNKARRNSTLVRRYGITEDEYFEMFKNQKGKCKLCGTKKPRKGATHLIVDHCHKTSKVRGLLCNDCNVLLGKLKDDIVFIDKIKAYLKASF